MKEKRKNDDFTKNELEKNKIKISTLRQNDV